MPLLFHRNRTQPKLFALIQAYGESMKRIGEDCAEQNIYFRSRCEEFGKHTAVGTP